MHVNVKWGKELFQNVEVDLEQTPLLFKSQLYTLTGVLPERQKIIVKAKVLEDDSWDSVRLKEGQTVLLMGSADTTNSSIAAPSEPTVFIEDLPAEEQDLFDMKKYGAGLKNLGNTCYMNSTMQLLFAVPELRDYIENYQYDRDSADLSDQLTAAAGALFQDMVKSSTSVMPVRFLLTLRNKYPQFAEMGPGGIYKQQDAEECFSQVLHIFNEKLKVKAHEDVLPSSQVQELFGVDVKTVLHCAETGESIPLSETKTKIECNIPVNPPIHHVHEGIHEGFSADRQQKSERTDAEVKFEGRWEITKLSNYVLLHLVRFSFRNDTQKRAKILRKVSFPPMMDLYQFCSDEYKATLDKARKKQEELKDQEIEQKKGTEPVQEAAGSSAERASNVTKALTGCYDLMGVLTHKGRSANSGHYVSWIKQSDEQWVEFDDENLIFRKQEDIMELSGGGDWHMAYILLYKAQTVDLVEESTSTDVEMKE